MNFIKAFKKIRLRKLINLKVFKNIKSFTLIELLVVISVMSLFSSIVLVAISSARDKAYNSYVIQTVKQYILALELYKIDHKTYPYADLEWYCFGEGYPSARCAYVDSLTPGTEDSLFNSQIQPYIKAVVLPRTLRLPGTCSAEDIIAQNCVSGPPTRFVGISYRCTSVIDSVCRENAIFWSLVGDVDCVIARSELFASNPDTGCFLNLVNNYGTQ